ncbi:hypothetical protein ACI65C_004322 [Semiaphis heraclei]
MPRQCSVISCSSIKSKQAVHLFKVRDSDFYAWNEIIRKVNGNSNRKVVYVCAEHFSNDDLITHYNGPNDLEKVKRHLVGLRKGAIPSIFDTSIDITENYNTVTPDLPDPSGKSTLTTEPFRKQLFSESIAKRICLSSQIPIQETFTSYEELLMPVGWMLYRDECIVSLYKPIKSECGSEMKVVIQKQIVFQSNILKISYYVNQKCRDPKVLGLSQLTYPLDFMKINETIKLFEQKQICQSGPSVINFPGTYIFLIA